MYEGEACTSHAKGEGACSLLYDGNLVVSLGSKEYSQIFIESVPVPGIHAGFCSLAVDLEEMMMRSKWNQHPGHVDAGKPGTSQCWVLFLSHTPYGEVYLGSPFFSQGNEFSLTSPHTPPTKQRQ